MEQKLGEAKGEATRLQEKLSLAEEELHSAKSRLGRAQTELADLRESEEEQEQTSTRLREKLLRLEVSTETGLHARVLQPTCGHTLA